MTTEVDTTTSRLLQATIDKAVEHCRIDGVTPSEAARFAVANTTLDSGSLYYLAVIGLARLLQDRIAAPRRSRPVANRPSPAARREILYERTMDKLASLLQGADGTMREIYDFTAEDHRHRLRECEKNSSGWRRAARFHQETLTELKRAGAASIRNLGRDMQAKLGGLL